MKPICPQCGAPVAAGQMRCDYCGAAIDNAQQPVNVQPQPYAQPHPQPNGQPQTYGQPQPYAQPYGQQPYAQPYGQPSANPAMFGVRVKNKWVSFLLCLFLGYLGAHKFYEGKVGMGILYLFTGGLFGIGWFIDCIVLLCKPNPYYVR